jgi:hypothetical protein
MVPPRTTRMRLLFVSAMKYSAVLPSLSAMPWGALRSADTAGPPSPSYPPADELTLVELPAMVEIILVEPLTKRMR